MNRILLLGALGASLVTTATAAHAVTVDFNSLPDGDTANPYVSNGATFTTGGGFNVIASGFGSPALCASPVSNNPANCSNLLEVTFLNPIEMLSFTFAGNNTTTIGADIGDVQFFSGVVLLGTADVIVVDGNATSFDLASYGAFSNVTRLLISSTDFGGVVYDDFTWNPSQAVPEPATWAMLILGMGVVGSTMRRRRRVRVSFA